MPYVPPTLAQCVDKSRQDFAANLPGSNAWLFPNNISVSAKVFGGLIWGAFRFLSWILKQVLVTTSSREYLYLHGAELGVVPLLATGSSGPVTVTGTPTFVVPIGTSFVRQDGLVYTTTAGATIPGGGVIDIAVETSVTGALTNALVGTPLSNALTGITNVVSNGVLGGTDAESVEAYRQRVLYKKRNPPAVGSPTDYVRWAMDFPGVTRVFVTRAQFGPGTVGVQFMMDGTYANGIPVPGDVTAILAYLNALAPSDASIIVTAPVAQPISITIGTLKPDTPAVRGAILDELTGMFQRRAIYSPTGVTKFDYSWIDEAISRAQGEDSHDLVAPSADVTVAAGNIPTLGVISYV